MKKIALLLCIFVFTLSNLCIFVSADSGITIGEVAILENADPALYTVKVNFTAASTVEQLTVLLTSEDVANISDAVDTKIIWLDQLEKPSNGVYEFVIEKRRVATVFGTTAVGGKLLYLKIGGTGQTEAATKVIAYPETTQDVLYGDVTGDATVDIGDAIKIMRYDASLDSLTDAQKTVGDVTGDAIVDIGDAIKIMRYDAGLESTLK